MNLDFFSSIAISEKYGDSSLSICTSHSALWAVTCTGMELHPHTVFLLQVQSKMKEVRLTPCVSSIGEVNSYETCK